MQPVDIDGVFLEWRQIPATSAAAARRAPLVFLHEGLGSVALWRDWPESLCAATGRAGWLYSRQGYGRSSPIEDVRGEPRQHASGRRSGRLRPDYLHREALQVLPRLLQQLGVARPVLVGHSDGATIALIHAAHHAVSACVVMAPHVIGGDDIDRRALEAARDAFVAGPLRERLARYHDDVDSAFWQWNDIWLSPALQQFDIRAECRGIGAPLLAIQGEGDEYASMAQLDEIARAVPQAELLKLPDCGHTPHRDQPDTVNAAIARFLAQHAA